MYVGDYTICFCYWLFFQTCFFRTFHQTTQMSTKHQGNGACDIPRGDAGQQPLCNLYPRHMEIYLMLEQVHEKQSCRSSLLVAVVVGVVVCVCVVVVVLLCCCVLCVVVFVVVFAFLLVWLQLDSKTRRPEKERRVSACCMATLCQAESTRQTAQSTLDSERVFLLHVCP